MTARDRDGATWRLLGLAVQTDPHEPDPADQIGETRSDDVCDAYLDWAGRWVLIGKDQLHMDVSGLLGCFYGVADGATPSELWISSSPALAAELTRSDPLYGRVEQITEGRMNWYPPPYSRYRAIRRLLPTQLLTLATGRVQPRPLIREEPRHMRYEAILDALQETLLAAVRRVAGHGGKMWVPLSAGYDSRLVLALALYADCPVATYTMRKTNEWRCGGGDRPVTSYVSRADMTLPPLIARAAGVEHRWIPKGTFSRQALDLFDRHTAGHTVENDRVYCSHGQWDWTQGSDMILRGGVFEVGHCFYWKMFPHRLKTGVIPESDEILEAFQVRDGSVHARGIRAWTEWVVATPHVEMDWRDRMYIEQRIAGWLSALEQALDATEAERFYVVNSGRAVSLLTRIPEDQRLRRSHHVDLIARMAPALLRFPFNPPDPVHRRIGIRVLRGLGRLDRRRRQTKWLRWPK